MRCKAATIPYAARQGARVKEATSNVPLSAARTHLGSVPNVSIVAGDVFGRLALKTLASISVGGTQLVDFTFHRQS